MQLLLNDYVSISYDPTQKMVRFSRSKNRYPLNEETRVVLKQITDIFEQVGRDKSLLIDMRDAPLRNDEQFESFTSNQNDRLFAGFSRVAILVKTAVGELQFARLKREGRFSAMDAHVFRDETEALTFLQEKAIAV
jgi:hypothetical protein